MTKQEASKTKVDSELSIALVSSGNCDSSEEANNLIEEMRERVTDGENPEEVLQDYGFEPDYIFDILP